MKIEYDREPWDWVRGLLGASPAQEQHCEDMLQRWSMAAPGSVGRMSKLVNAISGRFGSREPNLQQLQRRSNPRWAANREELRRHFIGGGPPVVVDGVVVASWVDLKEFEHFHRLDWAVDLEASWRLQVRPQEYSVQEMRSWLADDDAD